MARDTQKLSCVVPNMILITYPAPKHDKPQSYLHTRTSPLVSTTCSTTGQQLGGRTASCKSSTHTRPCSYDVASDLGARCECIVKHHHASSSIMISVNGSESRFQLVEVKRPRRQSERRAKLGFVQAGTIYPNRKCHSMSCE